MQENLLSLSSIFEQYKNASKIDGEKDYINLKIRNNTIKFKLSNMLFKNMEDNKREKENLISTHVKAVKTTNISEDEFKKEHLKMAHLNSQDLAIWLRANGFKIKNETIKDFTCNECSKSKSTVKRPFNIGPIADKSITLPGQMIHFDIAGPEQAYNNRNYTINLVDEISELVHVEFMKNKSETPEMIEKGLKEMKSIYKLSIQKDATFQSDGEQICKSKKVEDTLAKLNLYQKFSPAYHPERNGTAERTYRTMFLSMQELYY